MKKAMSGVKQESGLDTPSAPSPDMSEKKTAAAVITPEGANAAMRNDSDDKSDTLDTETSAAISTPVKEPHENDVLCGRGGSINSHPGNERFRQLVERRKRVYLTARFKREKRLIANSIVSEIRGLSPSGRFLTRDPKTGLWCDIGDEKARDKTSQALRENAPSIRAKMEVEINQQRAEMQQREQAEAEAAAAAAAHHHHYGPPPPPGYYPGAPPPGSWGYHGGFYAHGYHPHPHHYHQPQHHAPPPQEHGGYGHHPLEYPPSTYAQQHPQHRRSWSYDEAERRSPRASPAARRGRPHGHYAIQRSPSHDSHRSAASHQSQGPPAPYVTPQQAGTPSRTPSHSSGEEGKPTSAFESIPKLVNSVPSSLAAWTKTSFSFGGHSGGSGDQHDGPRHAPTSMSSSVASVPKPLSYVHHSGSHRRVVHFQDDGGGRHHQHQPQQNHHRHHGGSQYAYHHQHPTSASGYDQPTYESAPPSQQQPPPAYSPIRESNSNVTANSITPEGADSRAKRDASAIEPTNEENQNLLSQVAHHIMGSWDTSTMMVCASTPEQETQLPQHAAAAPQIPSLPQRQNSLSSSENTGVGGATAETDPNATLSLPPVKEEEEGQEVELVEMMDYDEIGEPLMDLDDEDEDAKAKDEERMPAPPNRTVEIDWSSKLSCQSQWLPDTFSGNSFFSPRSGGGAAPSSIRASNSLELEDNSNAPENFSHAGSVGGASLTKVFTDDSSKAGQGRVAAVAPAPVEDHLDLTQMPSWERSFRSRSPSTIGSDDDDDAVVPTDYGISPRNSKSPPTSPRGTGSSQRSLRVQKNASGNSMNWDQE